MNPDYGFVGKNQFIINVRKKYPDISKDDIINFYNNQTGTQIFKKIKDQKENLLKINDNPNSYQIDLMFMNKSESKVNKGYYIFFVMIDILSRRAFIYPIKNRTTAELIKGFNLFLEDLKSLNKYCIKVIGDNEFENKEFIKLLDKNDIQYSFHVAADDHFIKNSSNALGIIDRFIKTIKLRILKYQKITGNINFIDQLDKILNNYNNSEHSTIKTTPEKMFYNDGKQEQFKIKNDIYNDITKEEFNLNVGDYVRCVKKTKLFDKENQTYSTKIYIINQIIGNKYLLKDDKGNEKKHKYKFNELLKIDVINNKTTIDNDYNKKTKKLKQIKKQDDTLNKEGINRTVIIDTKTRGQKQKKVDKELKKLN